MQVLKDLPLSAPDPHLIDPKSTVSVDSLVGPSTKVAERTSIKKSIVGRHCVVGKNVKITNSVLMDHCAIEDGYVFNSCRQLYKFLSVLS